MATISSLGLGSGLDVESIITKLMAVEQQPITDINNRTSGLKTKLSTYGTLVVLPELQGVAVAYRNHRVQVLDGGMREALEIAGVAFCRRTSVSRPPMPSNFAALRNSSPTVTGSTGSPAMLSERIASKMLRCAGL